MSKRQEIIKALADVRHESYEKDTKGKILTDDTQVVVKSKLKQPRPQHSEQNDKRHKERRGRKERHSKI